MDNTIKAAYISAAAAIVATLIPLAVTGHWFTSGPPVGMPAITGLPATSSAAATTGKPTQGTSPAERPAGGASGGQSGNTACPPYANSPRLCLAPASGPAGQHVTATAVGFGSRLHVQIFFQGELVGQADTDGGGIARISFTVPSNFSAFAGMDETVDAGAADGNSAQALFKVT